MRASAGVWEGMGVSVWGEDRCGCLRGSGGGARSKKQEAGGERQEAGDKMQETGRTGQVSDVSGHRRSPYAGRLGNWGIGLCYQFTNLPIYQILRKPATNVAASASCPARKWSV